MKRIALILVILVVVVGVTVGIYLKFGPRQVSAASNLTTATAQLGNLVATVNSAGNITPHQSVVLNFGQTGTVQKVDVNVGDQVKAGQVLAELDTADLQLQVQNAQTNVKIAQDKLAQTQTPNTPEAIANARAQLDSAKATVTSSQAAYAAALKTASTSNSSVVAAAATLDKAQAALQAAQAAYDRVASRPDIAMLSQSTALQSATDDYNAAKANYDALLATSGATNASSVASAKAQLQQAQSSEAQAQNNLDTLLAGSDATTLDIAKVQLDQAQIALQQAQLNLANAEITAPFDGVVTAVNITPGQSSASTSDAIQLADLGHLEIVVSMDEIDVTKIKVGQDAQITLDALPNLNLQGKVTDVAPAGTITQGVVNYPVTVALTNPPADVKTGMSANVNIIVDQRNNVLTVPNRAIQTQGRQKFVTVLFEGQQMQVPVTTGMTSDTATEILSGLKEGDVVVISGTTTTQPRIGGGFGGGVPFVGGR